MNPIESKCCKIAEEHGFLSHKMGVDVSTGWPDRMFVGYGRVCLFVEFKRPKEPLRPRQVRKIKKFAERGIMVHVVDNMEYFENLIRTYKK